MFGMLHSQGKRRPLASAASLSTSPGCPAGPDSLVSFCCSGSGYIPHPEPCGKVQEREPSGNSSLLEKNGQELINPSEEDLLPNLPTHALVKSPHETQSHRLGAKVC